MAPTTQMRQPTSRPLDAEYARLHRILQIIQLIQQQNGWDAKALARACGVTQRTIYRDLKLLEGANIPFAYDDGDQHAIGKHGGRIGSARKTEARNKA